MAGYRHLGYRIECHYNSHMKTEVGSVSVNVSRTMDKVQHYLPHERLLSAKICMI